LTTNGKFLPSLPMSKTPNYHPDASSVVANASQTVAVTNVGGWAYDNNTGDPNWGNVWVNCTDTDSKGAVWTTY
jgi:hypothetical protein